MHIYSRAAAKGKRVQVGAVCFPPLSETVYEVWQLINCGLQSNMGAKNHAIVMPDANVDATINASVY
jgi:malonate-semialdehyde dehydrogenase (acetylating)/methylmalonate-semialdehyde dehydrogenase